MSEGDSEVWRAGEWCQRALRRLCFAVCASAPLLLTALISLPAHAAIERYDYDALGRVVRYTDPQGRVTAYNYDGAGNILSVQVTQPLLPPTVTSVTPSGVRRGETRSFTLIGSSFANASVTLSSPSANVVLSGLVVTPTQITFSLAAAAAASLGAQVLTVTTPGGSTTTNISILPALPTILIEPTPLAIPPDSVARDFAVVLSGADGIDQGRTAR